MFARLNLNRCAVAMALLAWTAASAYATQLVDVQGTVLINRGAGFQRAVAPVELQPGDRVLATSGASGRIIYSTSCSAVVSSGTAVIVRSQPPCPGGSGQAAGTPTETFVVGGLVVGGVAAGALALGGQGSNPASP